MNAVQFTVLGLDYDGMVRFAVRATGRNHSAYHETTFSPESLAEFAGALEKFPSAEAVLGVGAPDADFLDHLCLRVFLVKPTGQSALEFRSRQPGTPPEAADIHFYLRGLPLDFNRIGAALRPWLADASEPLLLEWDDGW